jgi:hypothetical protein
LPIGVYLREHTHVQHLAWLEWLAMVREAISGTQPTPEPAKPKKLWSQMTKEERRAYAAEQTAQAQARFGPSVFGTDGHGNGN